MAETTKHPRWQWSLRAMLLGTLATTVVLTLVIAPVRRQRRVVEEIQRRGGAVTYDHESRDNPTLWAPDWAVEMLGVDYFANVERVRFEYRPGGDELAALVAQIPHVQEVYFDGAGVTNVGLENLRDLTNLRHLSLHACPINNDGLIHLEKLTNLEVLNLHGTWVSDDGLKHLTHLKQLSFLGTPMGANRGATFEGLSAFAKQMPQVRNLQDLKPNHWPARAPQKAQAGTQSDGSL